MSLGMAGFSVRGRMDEIRDGWVFRVRHVLESARWESVINTVACFQPQRRGVEAVRVDSLWWGGWRSLGVSLSQIRHLTQEQPRLEGCLSKRIVLWMEREDSDLPEQ